MSPDEPQKQQSAIDYEALEIHHMSHQQLLDELLTLFYATSMARYTADFDTVEKNHRRLGMMREEALQRMSLVRGSRL